jgi:cob(I)alamin adenosyltransferase
MDCFRPIELPATSLGNLTSSMHLLGYNSPMSPYYTRTGDDGTTGILGKARLPKYHPRIEALGTLDEVSAALGLSRALCQSPKSRTILMGIQRDLYGMMTEVAESPDQASHIKILSARRVRWLETQIDHLSATIPAVTGFILPGNSLSGAALALARTIVRRAERRVAELLDNGEIKNPVLLRYLNRLSSLCFTLEMVETWFSGKESTLAKK